MSDLLNTPQLAFPFRVQRDDVVAVEQDTEEEVIQNAEVVLRYRVGERSAQPDFGIAMPELRQGGADINQIVGAVRIYEPDATVDVVREALDADGLDHLAVSLGLDDNG